MPTVSIVIATYKRPEKLLRAIHSALAQTVQDIEILVAMERDDPAAAEVIASLGDPRVRAVVNPVKNGPGPARDTAAAEAASPWIAFLDDDDEWLPHKLERQIAVADDRTIVTSLSRVMSEEGVFIRPGRPYDGTRTVDEWLFDRTSWLRGGDAMLQTSSLMVPAGLMRTLGFGSSRHEEWELIIRATRQHGYRLVTVEEPLVIYYAGGLYPWRPSLEWIESMGDVMSPRAISGFCLNSATQGMVGKERNLAFRTFLRAAFRMGQPTLKQLFAYVVIWGVPHSFRWRLRSLLKRPVPKQEGV